MTEQKTIAMEPWNPGEAVKRADEMLEKRLAWVSGVDKAVGQDRTVLMVCERVEGVVQLVDHCDLLDRTAVDEMLARCLSRDGIEWLRANLDGSAAPGCDPSVTRDGTVVDGGQGGNPGR